MDELIGDTIAEIVLLRVAAEDRERQHGDRLGRRCHRLCQRCGERRWRRLLMYLAHRRDELVATAGHGDDEAPAALAVGKGTAQRRDHLVEVVFFDDYVGPDDLEQSCL